MVRQELVILVLAVEVVVKVVVVMLVNILTFS